MDPPSCFDEENSRNSSYLSLSFDFDGDEVATNPTISATIRSTPIILQIITTQNTTGGLYTAGSYLFDSV
jgi:hypothetical protein